MADFEGRLKSESERYMALLERLGEKLSKSIAVDVNTKGTPSRDWARSFGNYSTGVRGMLQEQRERARLKLLAGKAGQVPLTDEEYEAELKQLAMDSVRELPEQELRAELARRGFNADDLATPDDL